MKSSSMYGSVAAAAALLWQDEKAKIIIIASENLQRKEGKERAFSHGGIVSSVSWPGSSSGIRRALSLSVISGKEEKGKEKGVAGKRRKKRQTLHCNTSVSLPYA